ncbi:MAG: thymidine phosphorylase, partial [Clostridia bacterium]|nr:thymidine phosphorylase [Clostridia bacterium]
MANSGNMLDLSRFGDLSVDKHSTGGVGDKTTLIVAPIVAAVGAKVAKMSGRGLGHTGGTIDKLESIPGYRTNLSSEEFLNQVENTGIAVIGQTENLAVADKLIYSLRDVTATVESLPLIVSSIMSKKLASGSKSIVLDVKYGTGAIMKTARQARELAQKMVSIGKACGRNMAALITDMNAPLGDAVGNNLEVIEAVEILQNKKHNDLRDVCVRIATVMLELALNVSCNEAEKMVIDSIESGAAFAKMKEWICTQGGDCRFLDDTSLFPKASFIHEVRSTKSGYINAVNAEMIGSASVTLGAGRAKKDDVIDYSAGIIINKKLGDYVKEGDVIFTLFTNDKSAVSDAEKLCINSLSFGAQAPKKIEIVYEIIR